MPLRRIGDWSYSSADYNLSPNAWVASHSGDFPVPTEYEATTFLKPEGNCWSPVLCQVSSIHNPFFKTLSTISCQLCLNILSDSKQEIIKLQNSTFYSGSTIDNIILIYQLTVQKL